MLGTDALVEWIKYCVQPVPTVQVAQKPTPATIVPRAALQKTQGAAIVNHAVGEVILPGVPQAVRHVQLTTIVQVEHIKYHAQQG